MVHHMYYGYKVQKNEDGNFEIIKSELVDNLNDLPEGYDYISEEFFEKVDAYNKNIVFDYENGPEYESDLVIPFENELDTGSRGK